jgi:hypothetical protein
LPKLDVLQQLLPEKERLTPTTYGIFRDILDHESTSDPSYAWALVDSQASYSLQSMRELQELANIADGRERHAALRERAHKNGVVYSDKDIQAADKVLVFIRNLDLDNLSREGKIKAGATLLAWESWKGTLRFDNPAQVTRLEAALNRSLQGDGPVYNPATERTIKSDNQPGNPHA